MTSRIVQPPRSKSYFLFGPRGTGKSTWLKRYYPKANYIDLLEDEVFNELLAHPDHLLKFIDRKSDTVIIDDVQKIPSLLNVVHKP